MLYVTFSHLSSVAWSKVSGSINAAKSPLSRARIMSPRTLSSTVSVEWLPRYTDYSDGDGSVAFRYAIGCLVTSRFNGSDAMGRFDIHRQDGTSAGP
jgi:hypothetical protein